LFSFSFTNHYKTLVLTLLNPLSKEDEGLTFHLNKQDTTTIEEQNQKPVASCSANRTSGIVPLSVSFTGSGTDSDGNIASYSWAFGDGFISTQQNTSHIFTKEGTYKVMLTVTDDKGATDSDTISITVKVPEPVILEDVSYSFLDTRVDIDGIIKNVANVPINNVVIKATLYDKAGNIIGHRLRIFLE
jgi:PKD repeat protein